MRAQNYKEITHAYWKFSGYLIATVFVGVFIYFCYIRTSGVEVTRIVEKTGEYDEIYVQQIDLGNRIDSLLYYSTLFNTNKNDAQLSNLVSRRKQEIVSMMDNMNGRDIRLYQKLMSEVNVFLGVKDSIRSAKLEEGMIKADLLRCAGENKQTSRQLTIGGITVRQ